MTLDVHRPYPGVALAVVDDRSVLFGAPADAFKATKKYCNDHELPFPRSLVAPQALLVEAAPQFNPEFFLYDFLFVYGAAFKPELASERLELVMDENQVQGAFEALRITLNGPSRDEMSGYSDPSGATIMSKDIVNKLATVSEHMALKQGDKPRTLDTMLQATTFGRDAGVELLGGRLHVEREGPQSFRLRAGEDEAVIDLSIVPPVIPFATLPVPTEPNHPLTFGIKPLGTRNGFDLSGPTTGFLLWVNGRGVIYDGPVGTRYLLESQGISPEDVDTVVLSHCHEDHMGAFVELFLAGYRPKVYTAEPIYRSALVKLSSYFNQPPEQVAQYIDYYRVEPGKPVEELGARFDFFYTVHSIPTVGLSVSMKDASGQEHSIQLSGDTMHHEGLDDMLEKGVIDKDFYAQMRHLVPDKSVANKSFFADVGEAIIHGHPKDWAENPNDVIYYHCPDNDHTRSFGKQLAFPGQVIPKIEPRKLHPATPGRLLSALRFLDIKEPGWVQSLLHQGDTRSVKAGEALVQTGENSGDKFSVIVTGTASVAKDNGHGVTTLLPGDFFGVIELVDDKRKSTATITAETPMELFEVSSGIFYDYIARHNLEDTISHIWAQRPGVESAKLFRRLDLAVRNKIARVASAVNFSPGEVIFSEGETGETFYVLVDGQLDVTIGGKVVTTISAEDDDNFVGEMEALNPGRKAVATVTAKSSVRMLAIAGPQLLDLAEGHMGIRYALRVAMEGRT